MPLAEQEVVVAVVHRQVALVVVEHWNPEKWVLARRHLQPSPQGITGRWRDSVHQPCASHCMATDTVMLACCFSHICHNSPLSHCFQQKLSHPIATFSNWKTRRQCRVTWCQAAHVTHLGCQLAEAAGMERGQNPPRPCGQSTSQVLQAPWQGEELV